MGMEVVLCGSSVRGGGTGRGGRTEDESVVEVTDVVHQYGLSTLLSAHTQSSCGGRTYLGQELDSLLLNHIHHTIHSPRVRQRVRRSWRWRSILWRWGFKVESRGVGFGEVGLESEEGGGGEVRSVRAEDESSCQCASGEHVSVESEVGKGDVRLADGEGSLGLGRGVEELGHVVSDKA
jgi:hypothetical protein